MAWIVITTSVNVAKACTNIKRGKIEYCGLFNERELAKVGQEPYIDCCCSPQLTEPLCATSFGCTEARTGGHCIVGGCVDYDKVINK